MTTGAVRRELRDAAAELVAVTRSDTFQRFLAALRPLDTGTRRAILHQVLNGPASGRVDLNLPNGVECGYRPFADGPPADLTLTKRAPQSGALVSIFVTVDDDAPRGARLHRVIPWQTSVN